MHRLSASVLAMLLSLLSLLNADVIDDYAPGRSGEALKNTISRHCRPSYHVDEQHLVQHIFAIFTADDGITRDGLNGLPIDDPDFAMISCIVPTEWMNPDPNYLAEATIDLHNMLIADGATAIDRGQLPLSDQREGYDCVTPPENMKGDIARAIFYVASIYPCRLWGSWGRGIFDNTPYPTLKKEWSDMYMRWHKADPVDSDEKARNEAIASLQGNLNPFITHPDLADYLWGAKAGEVYRPSSQPGKPENPDNPETPSTPLTPIPLQSSYDSHDDYIWLYSPYVPADATWSIDGNAVAERITVASLSIGTHEVRFKSATSAGKLIIEIKP